MGLLHTKVVCRPCPGNSRPVLLLQKVSVCWTKLNTLYIPGCRNHTGCLIFLTSLNGGSSKTAYRKGVSRPCEKRRSEVKGRRCETGFADRPYNNHARCGVIIIIRKHSSGIYCRTKRNFCSGINIRQNESGGCLAAQGCQTMFVMQICRNCYLPAGPIIASMVPAATAVPITPATLGPIACISRKLEGLAF